MAIDPGLTGGIAIINKGNRMVFRMPVNDFGHGNEVDPFRLQDFIVGHQIGRVAIEKQQTVHARGAMRNGMNMGALITTARLCGIRPDIISPTTWQRHFLGKRLSREERKQQAIQIALDNGFNIPTLNPTGKKLHDGCADATCILLYAIGHVWVQKLDSTFVGVL